MKTWKPAEGDGEFNLTPMIDVVFLLITFFMTVTSYACRLPPRLKCPTMWATDNF